MKTEDSEKNIARLTGNGASGWNVPEGYFEQLTSDILKKADKLPSTSQQGFHLPDDYFETLPDSIAANLQNTKPQEKGRIISISVRRILLPVSIAAMLIAGVFIYKAKHTKPESVQEEMLTSDDLNESGILMDIDEETIIEQIADEKSAPSRTDSLMQYLIDNKIEISDIENQL